MQKINIPEPCSVPWNEMLPHNDNMRHCESCQTPVIDFTNKSLAEIEAFIAATADKNVCGNFKASHTQQTSRHWTLINRMENFLFRHNMRKLFVLLIGGLLLFASCRRHVRGRMSAYGYMPKKQENKSQQQRR
ncbi:MAG: hypothetical protein K0S33_488 [Bacteroidetes bacterium]|jgi:hypothetical protein|nr:hypothetical protein [Bacteroidota bacterium]